MAALNQNGGDFEFTKELVQALMNEKFGDKVLYISYVYVPTHGRSIC